MDINFGCSTCSKESYATIPIARIIEKLDLLFDKNDLDSVGKLLDYWDGEARNLGDERGLLEILNEKIGYYRRTNDRERGLRSVEDAFALIDKIGADNSESSGTVYLNGATTMKAFGKTREAMPYYEKARQIYEKTLPENDFKFAAYYNNVSSAYKELGEMENTEKS